METERKISIITNILFGIGLAFFIFSLFFTYAMVDSNKNNIQAAHVPLSYYWANNDTFCINDIQEIRKLTGYSMQPSSFSKNKILVRTNFTKNDIQEGVMITYLDGNETIHHRVRGLYGDRVYAQGDNSQNGDFINISQIYSITVGTIYT